MKITSFLRQPLHVLLARLNHQSRNNTSRKVWKRITAAISIEKGMEHFCLQPANASLFPFIKDRKYVSNSAVEEFYIFLQDNENQLKKMKSRDRYTLLRSQWEYCCFSNPTKAYTNRLKRAGNRVRTKNLCRLLTPSMDFLHDQVHHNAFMREFQHSDIRDDDPMMYSEIHGVPPSEIAIAEDRERRYAENKSDDLHMGQPAE